jgi:hypothetical protein
MREATGGYALGIGALCVPCVVAAVLMTWLMREPAAVVDVQDSYKEEAIG